MCVLKELITNVMSAQHTRVSYSTAIVRKVALNKPINSM